MPRADPDDAEAGLALRDAHAFGLRPLLPLAQFKFDPLALFKGTESVHLNG